MNRKARATMHGAISIVNAIATGKGSSLGISLKVVAEVTVDNGFGIKFQGDKNDKLINNIVRNVFPKDILQNKSVSVKVDSEIPARFGLKSSSAVSNAVSLACNKIVHDDVDDFVVIDTAVRASLDAKVTVTGAYDDASACYFGGFAVTDNYAQKLLRRDEAPPNLLAIIHVGKNAQRGNVQKLKIMSDLFDEAFGMAEAGDYWRAMKLNGLLAAASFSETYQPMLDALEAGALSASISGNGPSIAAVTYYDKMKDIKTAFAKFAGRILVSRTNNQKAIVELIDG